MIKLNTEYMIFSPKLILTNSGKEMIACSISDSRKVGDKYVNEYYTLKINGTPKLSDRQKIKIAKINGINCYSTIGKDGKTYYNKELYIELEDENTNEMDEFKDLKYSVDMEDLPF